MELSALLTQLNEQPENVVFSQVIDSIDEHYRFTPTAFENGATRNEANQNNGSCKIFAFAQLNQLSVNATLACFGDYYRLDVLQHPDNDDHQNIRNFIRFGWDGVKFEGTALTAK